MAEYRVVRLHDISSPNRWADVEIKRDNIGKSWRLLKVREVSNFKVVTPGHLAELAKGEIQYLKLELRACNLSPQQRETRAKSIEIYTALRDSIRRLKPDTILPY